MIILTEEIKKKILPLGYHGEIYEEEVNITLRFFCPQNSWEWFVTEGKEDDAGEWVFWGYVKKDFNEWELFTLKELNDFESKTGYQVIRDPYFLNKKIKDIL